MKTQYVSINARELATVLVALRYYQSKDLANSPALRPDDIHAIATDGSPTTPSSGLTGTEVDTLCDRLNVDTADHRLATLLALSPNDVTLLTLISRAAKMPAPCGIGSYAVGADRMEKLRVMVRRLSETHHEDTRLVTAAKALLVNADDRGDTRDEETGQDYADWAELREALREFSGEEAPRNPPKGQMPEIRGQLYAPNGKRIVASMDLVPGNALIAGVTRCTDGTLDIEWEGETRLCWDGQYTEESNGLRYFLDEEGNQWREDRLAVRPE